MHLFLLCACWLLCFWSLLYYYCFASKAHTDLTLFVQNWINYLIIYSSDIDFLGLHFPVITRMNPIFATYFSTFIAMWHSLHPTQPLLLANCVCRKKMSSEGVGVDCLGWAARDASGVLSPYKFNRRYIWLSYAPLISVAYVTSFCNIHEHLTCTNRF